MGGSGRGKPRSNVASQEQSSTGEETTTPTARTPRHRVTSGTLARSTCATPRHARKATLDKARARTETCNGQLLPTPSSTVSAARSLLLPAHGCARSSGALVLCGPVWVPRFPICWSRLCVPAGARAPLTAPAALPVSRGTSWRLEAWMVSGSSAPPVRSQGESAVQWASSVIQRQRSIHECTLQPVQTGRKSPGHGAESARPQGQDLGVRLVHRRAARHSYSYRASGATIRQHNGAYTCTDALLCPMLFLGAGFLGEERLRGERVRGRAFAFFHSSPSSDRTVGRMVGSATQTATFAPQTVQALSLYTRQKIQNLRVVRLLRGTKTRSTASGEGRADSAFCFT